MLLQYIYYINMLTDLPGKDQSVHNTEDNIIPFFGPNLNIFVSQKN